MIPLYEPLLAGHEEEYLLEACFRYKELSGHSPIVRTFEERFADYVGVKHAIAVSSGTAALETALYGVGISAGDEVIMPSFTIISCALAVLRLGAIPVLVDVDSDTWCIDGAQVVKATTDRTKAVLAVDMFGHPAPISRFLRPFSNYVVVEDACQALGAQIGETKCGALGNVGCFSFYANKLITTGEGGMVTCEDDSIADRCRSYRNLCFGTDRKFLHEDLGYNFRMSGLQAAFGLGQLEAIDEFLGIKMMNARMYRELLADAPIGFQTVKEWAQSAHWMNAVVLENHRADDIISRLLDHRIESREFFVGLHEQPTLHGSVVVVNDYARGKPLTCGDGYLSVTEHLTRHGLYLPSGLNLRDDQIEFVCDTLRKLLEDRYE